MKWTQCEETTLEARDVSNTHGWQSKDKVESNPIFIKAIHQLKE